MRLIPINSVQEGSYLAKSIYDNDGRVLLREGVRLTDSLIKKITSIGVFTLYVQDEYSNNIIDDIIEPQLRQKAIKTVKDTFNAFERQEEMLNSNSSSANGKELRRQKHEQLASITQVAQDILNEILSRKKIMVNLVDIKSLDNYTYQHSVNVAILSLILGMHLKLSKYELYTLCVGAMLHDVGKVFIPAELLNKKNKLTEAELKVIKNHPNMGYEYLKDTMDVSAVARIIALQHHEWPNGQGYPEKRRDGDIHRLAKIVAIADVYDALTSDRPYRPALSPNEALEYIMASGGRQFDYELVKVFSQSIIPYPEGSLVKLKNGDIALVEEVNTRYPLRPKIKVIKGQYKDRTIDLINELSMVIDGLQYEAPKQD